MAETIDESISKSEFVAELERLKSASKLTYKQIAKSIDRPVTTVHGWFSGRHLPYQRDDDDFAAVLRLLDVDDVEPWVASLAVLRRPAPRGVAENPYRGLATYDEDDAAVFFGRAELIDDLVGLAAAAGRCHRLVLVSGASGSGKSSLLRAGLSARLLGTGRVVEYVAGYGPDTLAGVSAAVAAAGAARVVVILDQFESYLATASTARTIAELDGLCAAMHQHGQAIAVVGLRADYLHRVTEVPALLSAARDHHLVVGPMNASEVESAIVGPAGVGHFAVAPSLVATLLGEFASEGSGAEALPLLSQILYMMAEEARGGDLTEESYVKIGGLPKAVENAAEQAFDRLDDQEQAACRELFSHLVDISADASPVRRRVHFASLEAASVLDEIDFDPIIDKFASARLLSRGSDTVEIAHESLMRSWPRLAVWIEEDRAALMAIARVGRRAGEWEQLGEEPSALLRGPLLEQAREVQRHRVASSRQDDVTRRFVAASSAAEQAALDRRRRRRRLLGVTTVIATVCALIAAGLAVHAQRHSRRANDAAKVSLSRQLALQAAVLSGTDPALSNRLALLAYETAPTVEGRSALFDAAASPSSARFLGSPGATALAVSADGGTAAFSNSDTGAIAILKMVDGVLTRAGAIGADDPGVDVYSLALSADGRLLVAGGSDHAVRAWSIDQAEAPRPVRVDAASLDSAVQSVTIDDARNLVYAVGDSSGVHRWSITDGALRAEPAFDLEGSVAGVAVAATGTVAVADADGALHVRAADAGEWTTIDTGSGRSATSVAFHPSGRYLAAGFKDFTVGVWDLQGEPEPVEFADAQFLSWVNSVAFSPDGKWLAAGSSDNFVQLWSTDSWALAGPKLAGPTVVTNVRFLANDRLAVTAADGSLRDWRLDLDALAIAPGPIWALGYSADGNQMVIGSQGAHLWPMSGEGVGGLPVSFRPADAAVVMSSAASFSAGGDLVATADADGAIFVYDTNAADRSVARAQLSGIATLPGGFEFAPFGSLFAAGDDEGTVALYDASTASSVPIGRFNVGSMVSNLAFSPDGKTLAAATDSGDLVVYDIADPTEPVRLGSVDTGTSFAVAVVFDRAGKRLAVSNNDKTVSLFDMTDLARPRLIGTPITGPNSRVYWLDFSPDGRELAASVGDNSMWVWDVSTDRAPQVISILRAPEGPLYAGRYAPNGDFLAGAGGDGQVYIWPTSVDEARRQVCGAGGEGLSAQEWETYVKSGELHDPCSP